MKTARTALALSALLSGSLLLGVTPALAAPALACPATMHSVDPATHGGANCEPNVVPTEPLASGNNWSIWASQPTYAPGPPPVQPPPYKPLPAPAAPEVPNQVIQVPAGEARPGSVVAGGNAHGPNWAPAGSPAGAAAGETLQSVTPIAGQTAANGEAPAEQQAPAAAPAIVLPTTEVQAVDALRSATATPAEKDAAKAIVKTKIDAVLDKAIEKVLSGR